MKNLENDDSKLTPGELIAKGSTKNIHDYHNPNRVIAIERRKQINLLEAEYKLHDLLSTIYPQHFPTQFRIASDINSKSSLTEKEKIVDPPLSVSYLEFLKIVKELGAPYAQMLSSLSENESSQENIHVTKSAMSAFFDDIRNIGIDPFYNKDVGDVRFGLDIGNKDNFYIRTLNDGSHSIVYVDTVYPVKDILIFEGPQDKNVSVHIIDSEVFTNSILQKVKSHEIAHKEATKIFSKFDDYVKSTEEVNASWGKNL